MKTIKKLWASLATVPALVTAGSLIASCAPTTETKIDAVIVAPEGVTFSNTKFEIGKDFTTEIIFQREDYTVDTLSISQDNIPFGEDMYEYTESTHTLLIRGKFITKDNLKIELTKKLSDVSIAVAPQPISTEPMGGGMKIDGKYYSVAIIKGFKWNNYDPNETISAVASMGGQTGVNVEASVVNMDDKGNFDVALKILYENPTLITAPGPYSFTIGFIYRGKVVPLSGVATYPIYFYTEFAEPTEAPKVVVNYNAEPTYTVTWSGCDIMHYGRELSTIKPSLYASLDDFDVTIDGTNVHSFNIKATSKSGKTNLEPRSRSAHMLITKTDGTPLTEAFDFKFDIGRYVNPAADTNPWTISMATAESTITVGTFDLRGWANYPTDPTKWDVKVAFQQLPNGISNPRFVPSGGSPDNMHYDLMFDFDATQAEIGISDVLQMRIHEAGQEYWSSTDHELEYKFNITE